MRWLKAKIKQFLCRHSYKQKAGHLQSVKAGVSRPKYDSVRLECAKCGKTKVRR